MNPYLLFKQLDAAYDPLNDPLDESTILPRLSDYVTAEGEMLEPAPDGDALAVFIVAEVLSCWSPRATDKTQLYHALDNMRFAEAQVKRVTRKLQRLYDAIPPDPEEP